MKKKYVIPILLICITLFAYANSFTNDFVLLDDDYQVYENTLVQNLSFKNIETIFTSSVMRMYQPLVTLFFSFIAFIFGVESATAFHTFSLFIHLLNVLLVFSLGKKLLNDETKSTLLALLFAIHPLAVESVAWISATSTVFFSLFFLSALLSYILFLEKNQRKHYYISLLLFLIGCFCKVQIIPFVGVVFLVDFIYKKPFLSKTYLFQKLPFIFITIIFTFIAYNVRVVDQIGERPYSDIYFSGYQTIWYVIKNFVPINLVAIFNWPEKLTLIHHLTTIAFLPLIYAIYYFRKNRLFVFGVLFFLFNIGLHVAVISKFYAPYADRYAYISSIGIWIAVFSLFNKKQLLYSIGPFLLLLLFLTKTQVKTWKNTEALYTQNVKYAPNALSYNNLGYIHIDSNKSLAEEYFLKAIELDATYKDAYNNLGAIYVNKDAEKAAKYFLKLIELDPKYSIAYNNLGLIYMNTDKEKAIQYFEKSIQLNPTDLKIYNSLGILYMNINLKKSEAYFLKAIKLKPNDIAAYNNLALIYMSTNKEKAIQYLQKSIQLDPTDIKVYNSLGILHMDTNLEKAEMYFLKVIEFSPKNVEAHDNLGRLYFSTDKKKSEMYFLKTIALNPKYIDAYNNLGVIYATIDKNKAIAYFSKTLSLDPKNQHALFYLQKLRE